MLVIQVRDHAAGPGLLFHTAFLGHVKHWKASTDGEGPLEGFNRMAWTQILYKLLYLKTFLESYDNHNNSSEIIWIFSSVRPLKNNRFKAVKYGYLICSYLVMVLW